MTQENKELLLKDLCARLPYMPKIKITYQQQGIKGTDEGNVSCDYIEKIVNDLRNGVIIDMQIYLRPMSSMTEEEKEELLNLLFDKEAKYFYIDEEGLIDGKTSYLMKEGLNYPAFCPINIVLYTDWLNAHHFDYRGLIEKGLALEAPEGMY